jgi:hypothetical protein
VAHFHPPHYAHFGPPRVAQFNPPQVVNYARFLQQREDDREKRQKLCDGSKRLLLKQYPKCRFFYVKIFTTTFY